MTDVWDQYFETVTNGNAGRDNKEIIAVACVIAVFVSVEVVIEDQAGHNYRLTTTRSHLEGVAWQLVGRIVARSSMALPKLVEQVRASVGFFGEFVEPDSGFDSLLLGEK